MKSFTYKVYEMNFDMRQNVDKTEYFLDSLIIFIIPVQSKASLFPQKDYKLIENYLIAL